MDKRSLLLGVGIGVLLAVILMLTFSGGANTPAIDNTEVSQEDEVELMQSEPFTSLYRGNGERNFYSTDEEKTVIKLINDETELRNLWQQIFSGTLPPPLPDVDFDTQSILLVMSAQLSSRGYLLTINNVTIDDVITIDYQLKGPGAGCSPTAKETRPLHIIAVEKTGEKAIELNESTLQAAPCRVPLN